MSSFVDIPIETDPDQLADDSFERMATAFPGWEPAEGNLETWLIRTLAAVIGAPLAEVATQVPAEIFRRYGEVLFAITPLDAVAATATTTWTMIDNAGYTIPAGTQVAIRTAGDTTIGFRVVSEVQVAPGDTVTATGEVVIEAVLAGTAANGLTADPELIDALTFVSSINLETTTAGGVDAEEPDDYLNRLRDTLTLLSQNAILPADVEVLARSVAGVARATALDTYNPGDDTYDNEKYCAVAVVDAAGAACSSPVKAAVDALLSLHREVNFVFNVIDPSFTQVKVSVTVTAFEGNDPAGIETAVEQAITDYLSPSNWGLDPIDPDPSIWRNVPAVYRNELLALVDRVEGVDRVTALTLAEQAGVLGTADVTLDQPAPLPTPGTIACTVA